MLAEACSAAANRITGRGEDALAWDARDHRARLALTAESVDPFEFRLEVTSS